MLQRLLHHLHSGFLKMLNSPTWTDENTTLIDILQFCVGEVLKVKKNRLVPDQPEDLLKCLSMNPDSIKVVIIGQDPYPQPGVANGYAFSCEKPQPSIDIMVRELEKEYGLSDLAQTFDFTLSHWIKQGVLLLNSSLSCEEYRPNCHTEQWFPFTSELVRKLSDLKVTRESGNSIVFVLLGSQAKKMKPYINENFHYIIERYHPAAETHGSKSFEPFFKEVNKCLVQSNLEPVNWVE